MSIIEMTTGTYRSRVDGTLVLQVEIEPRHRDAALRLFGMPGTPGALAALKTASSKPEPEPKPKEREPLGPLCFWAVQRCREPQFLEWLGVASLHQGPFDAVSSRAMILRVCGIESRAELDTNPAAARIFDSKIRRPYASWLAKQGMAVATEGTA